MLCTIAQVKTRLGIAAADTASDAVLTEIARSVSDLMARAAGRWIDGVNCLEKVLLTEYLSPGQAMVYLWLTARPIVSVTSITEALYEDWTDGDVLTLNEEYQLDAIKGRLTRIGVWLPGERTVRVIYTGGYTYADRWAMGTAYVIGNVVQYLQVIYSCKKAHTASAVPLGDTTNWTAAPDERPLPDAINEGGIQQCQLTFQRQRDVGQPISANPPPDSAGGDGLLPWVAAAMREMRPRIGQ